MKETSLGWHHMFLQNEYVLFNINGAFTDVKAPIDGLLPSGKVFCGLTSPHFKLFLETVGVVSSGPKRKRTILTVIAAKFKSQHL